MTTQTLADPAFRLSPRTAMLPRSRLKSFFRRKLWPRHALYAGAICIGLALGRIVPVPETGCAVCRNADAAFAVDVTPGR